VVRLMPICVTRHWEHGRMVHTSFEDYYHAFLHYLMINTMLEHYCHTALKYSTIKMEMTSKLWFIEFKVF